MTYTKKWPEATYANIFIRPIPALSEEIQRRMIKRAIERLGVPHKFYVSPAKKDKDDVRGLMLSHCRPGRADVVIVARLNVLARPGVECKISVTRDLMHFVGDLLLKCEYILVLDDNLQGRDPRTDNSVTSKDSEWKEVYDRAINVATNGRTLESKKASDMSNTRWDREFKGVVEEWTENIERAEDLERYGEIWRDTKYINAKIAYEAMPDDVRAQITSVHMARKIFGKRKPLETKYGRPKKPT